MEALRKCALSMAAVAAVSAPLSFVPQEVLAKLCYLVFLAETESHQLESATCMFDEQNAVWDCVCQLPVVYEDALSVHTLS